jgi:hypothetical protein
VMCSQYLGPAGVSNVPFFNRSSVLADIKRRDLELILILAVSSYVQLFLHTVKSSNYAL